MRKTKIRPLISIRPVKKSILIMPQYLKCWCASTLVLTWWSNTEYLFHTFISWGFLKEKWRMKDYKNIYCKHDFMKKLRKEEWKSCWKPGGVSFILFFHESCRPLLFPSSPYIDLLLDGSHEIQNFLGCCLSSRLRWKFQLRYKDLKTMRKLLQ